MDVFSGKRILVTGSTGGMGLTTALKLSAAGARVLVHGRDPERVRRATVQVPGSMGLVADLSSLAWVRRLVEKLQDSPPLDLLINNAGVGPGAPRAGRQTSADGIELHWAVNFIAPFALTEWLVAGVPPPRAIVNVGAIGQDEIDFHDPQSTQAYDGIRAYRRSKLAMIAWTFDLAARYPSLPINAVHPGTLLASKVVREANLTPQSTVESGADAVLEVARRTLRGEARGTLFDRDREARALGQAYDDWCREQLRRLAEDQIRRAFAAWV